MEARQTEQIFAPETSGDLMDLYKAINELLEEKQRLDEVIARMEMLVSARAHARGGATGPIAVPTPRKRGRKGMSEEERAEVSRRMKEYWAKRRKSPAKAS